jgi:hypothetical protein
VVLCLVLEFVAVAADDDDASLALDLSCRSLFHVAVDAAELMDIVHSKPLHLLAELKSADDNSSVAHVEDEEEGCDTYYNEAVAGNSNSVAEQAAFAFAFAVGPDDDDDEHDDSVCSSELGMDCSRPLGWQVTEEEELPPLVEVRHGHGPSCLVEMYDFELAEIVTVL